jgi:hypothetical protein
MAKDVSVVSAVFGPKAMPVITNELVSAFVNNLSFGLGRRDPDSPWR